MRKLIPNTRPLILALIALLVVPAAAAAVERPIVYVVVVDGLDGDRVDDGRSPFLGSLIKGQGGRAHYYQESRSVMIAETNPNHVAMVTGAYGERSGNPGNAFALYAPLENDDSCKAIGPEDLTKMPLETSGENANCLLSQTVFEAVKRQGNPDGLVTAGIFGKPKLGRIFAGRRFDGKSLDADFLYAPCSSNSDDNATGAGDTQSGAPEESYCRRQPTNPVTGYAIDDRTVMDEVIRTIREGVGPTKKRPDLTFVNLHQVDSAGHGFGTGTGAYDQTIGLADDELERLVSELKARGEWSRTAMIVLSDHSMDTTLQKTTLTTRFSSAGVATSQFKVVQNGSVDAVYLANRTSPDRFELLKKLRAAALASPGVAEALYRENNPADGGAANTLDGVHPGWRAAGPRSADLFVVSATGAAFSDPREFPPSNPIPGNHGGPQTRDNFFAVLGGGEFINQRTLTGERAPLFDDTLQNPYQAENVDVAATVMGLFGLNAPRESQGRYLIESFDRSKIPGGAQPSQKPELKISRLRRASGSCVQRFRLSFAPDQFRYALRVRDGRKLRTLFEKTRRTTYTFRGRAGRTYRFRLRTRAASGAQGPANSGTARSPSCR